MALTWACRSASIALRLPMSASVSFAVLASGRKRIAVVLKLASLFGNISKTLFAMVGAQTVRAGQYSSSGLLGTTRTSSGTEVHLQRFCGSSHSEEPAEAISWDGCGLPTSSALLCRPPEIMDRNSGAYMHHRV